MKLSFQALYGALTTSLSYSYVGAALNNDGYFHILCLTPYQHLFIIRTLSSSRFPSSGFLCFFFLCVCVCVCVLFFFYYFFLPSLNGRIENLIFLILLFLPFQRPKVPQVHLPQVSIPLFLFFSLNELLFWFYQSSMLQQQRGYSRPFEPAITSPPGINTVVTQRGSLLKLSKGSFCC